MDALARANRTDAGGNGIRPPEAAPGTALALKPEMAPGAGGPICGAAAGDDAARAPRGTFRGRARCGVEKNAAIAGGGTGVAVRGASAAAGFASAASAIPAARAASRGKFLEEADGRSVIAAPSRGRVNFR